MDDLISRQAAIDALKRIFDRCEEIEAHLPDGDPDKTGYKMFPDYMTVWKYLRQLPSAQPDLDEWCTDCSEYDQERHCCPRWNRVIRQTLKDAQPTADVVEVVRCKDCKYYEPDGVCANINFLSVRPNDYCSYAEKI